MKNRYGAGGLVLAAAFGGAAVLAGCDGAVTTEEQEVPIVTPAPEPAPPETIPPPEEPLEPEPGIDPDEPR